MSETHAPQPQATAAQNDRGCPSDSGSNAADASQAAIISADLDVGTGGINLMTDVLGNDFVDASVGLGAVGDVVNTVLGLTDTGTGLLDGVTGGVLDGVTGGLLDGLLCDVL